MLIEHLACGVAMNAGVLLDCFRTDAGAQPWNDRPGFLALTVSSSTFLVQMALVLVAGVVDIDLGLYGAPKEP